MSDHVTLDTQSKLADALSRRDRKIGYKKQLNGISLYKPLQLKIMTPI